MNQPVITLSCKLHRASICISSIDVMGNLCTKSNLLVVYIFKEEVEEYPGTGFQNHGHDSVVK